MRHRTCQKKFADPKYSRLSFATRRVSRSSRCLTKTNLHIVHLAKYYDPAVGGMESLIRSQAQAQANSGHRVDVVAVNHLTETGNDVLGKPWGITTAKTVIDGQVVIHRVNRVGNFAKWDLSTSVGGTLKSIAANQPDVWHLHTPNVTMVLALQTLLGRCAPLVVTHHSDILKRSPLRPAYQLAERRVYERASIILSDSPGYIAGSTQLRPYLDKVKVLPIGVDLDKFRDPCEDVLAEEKKCRQRFAGPLWLCVGRLAEYKALHIAIEALVNVPGELAIVGVGPFERQWRQLAIKLKVENRVHWLGRCSDAELKGIYRAATALWFPSNVRNEGFGIVQVEAMASGCPVINTDLPHSGVSWVCKHEECGLTVPINDVDAFVLAAMRLVGEPGLRDRLSFAAKRHAEQRFDQPMLNEACLQFYERAVQPKCK